MNVFLISVFVIITLNSAKSDDSVEVRIENGLIRGKRLWFAGREYNQFLGIPYAEPPVETLRFKKPVPPKEKITLLEAYEWPDSCVHNRYSSVDHYFSDRMSEDCLYLNIWSPIAPESTDSLKPVMFFIHGGGLDFGSSSEDTYSGHVLATKGEVVVVTINYRLNIFGLLYTGTDEAPGNMALWDQALALEWVNDNIQYFGGDPNRITLFGESAGGWSTSLHILSPVTRNLFQNAIIMSGAAMDQLSACTPEEILELWIRRVEEAGCGDEENKDQKNKKFTTKMFECVNHLSTEALLKIPILRLGHCLIPLVIDGSLIVDRQIKSLRSGDFKNNLNLMIGLAEDEGSNLLSMFLDPIKFDKYNPKPLAYEEAINDIENIFNQTFDINGQEVAKVYFSGMSASNTGDILRRTMGMAIGDYIIGCPTILFGKEVHSNSPASHVYQYYFNSRAGDPNKLFCSQWMGVCHFNDIYPVFGVPFYDSDRYVDEERRVSQQMIEIFSAFATTGRPPAQSSAEWQPFYTLNDNTIAPFYEITTEPKPQTNFGLNLKITECEYLWKKYIIEENV